MNRITELELFRGYAKNPATGMPPLLVDVMVEALHTKENPAPTLLEPEPEPATVTCKNGHQMVRDKSHRCKQCRKERDAERAAKNMPRTMRNRKLRKMRKSSPAKLIVAIGSINHNILLLTDQLDLATKVRREEIHEEIVKLTARKDQLERSVGHLS